METQNNPPLAVPEVSPTDTSAEKEAILRAIHDAVERHKANPGYVQRVFDGAAEVRRRLNAEYLREIH